LHPKAEFRSQQQINTLANAKSKLNIAMLSILFVGVAIPSQNRQLKAMA
jgi:hypothetical protein